MAEHDWSRDEVEATVGDYFAMLRDELAGLRVNKSEHNERLRRLLRNRSKGSVEFKHVTFGYRTGQPVLKDVSFTVRPGETVALVGVAACSRSSRTLMTSANGKSLVPSSAPRDWPCAR